MAKGDIFATARRIVRGTRGVAAGLTGAPRPWRRALPGRGALNFAWVALTLIIWNCLTQSSAGEESAATVLEHKVKAAYLLNFARFVEWPANAFTNAAAPIVVGIIGEDPIGACLEQMVQNQTVQHRKIVLRHLGPQDDAGACQILFLSETLNANDQRELLERLKARSVLTVSDKRDFVQQGGMVGFVLVEANIRFDISRRAAEAAALKFSSKLLKVARKVD